MNPIPKRMQVVYLTGQRIESNAIAPLVARIFPLTRLAEAQRYFETKQHIGKIVIGLSNGEPHLTQPQTSP